MTTVQTPKTFAKGARVTISSQHVRWNGKIGTVVRGGNGFDKLVTVALNGTQMRLHPAALTPVKAHTCTTSKGSPTCAGCKA